MEATQRLVSTGQLPGRARTADLVRQAWERFRTENSGTPSRVYPTLATADPALFGVCVAGVTGVTQTAGDADFSFPIMSVAKPFTFALACEATGIDGVRERLGVDATGLAFDSIEAVERGAGRTNPMVNPGALATVDLLSRGRAGSWSMLSEGLARFAGRPLTVDENTYACAGRTNTRNRALAHLLDSYGVLDGDPAEVLDLYTRQSCLSVTARDLAVMGATLADGGVNPVTGERVVNAAVCRATLAVMATAGLYETSGEWLYRVGLPGKSGIGGGIITASPGKGGLGTFSPPLDRAGNSVRGQRVAEFLSAELGLDLFASDVQRMPEGVRHGTQVRP
ncbi:glutaminase A [Actinoplanes sp. NPDC051633]|uniref:glutaminase A n=1 Tax=Actinoplanes sp. NPDC051633 TaxID=3155670 RepID=UPI0034224152